MYVLGSLLPDEAAAFTSHLGECAACRAEVGAFAQVTGDLALVAEPVVPSPQVRERLLAAAARPRFEFVTTSEGEWLPLAPGVSHKPLGTGIASKSYLLRIDPGHAVPRHTHTGVEHCVVLSGTVEVAGRMLHPGDFHLAARGSVHETVSSREGCVLLIVEAS
jgi:anti-sigma factor ChrR (cupin superfamily)